MFNLTERSSGVLPWWSIANLLFPENRIDSDSSCTADFVRETIQDRISDVENVVARARFALICRLPFWSWKGRASLRRAVGCKMTFLNRANQSFLTHARLWYLVDAKDQINGRLASYLSQVLQGKTKPIYHHTDDVGDYVVVINTRHIVLSGTKWKNKLYRHHTGYPGGLKSITARELHKRDATRILWRAVYGMLPKNNLRPIWMNRLFLFEDNEHPYAENIFAKLEGPAPLPKRLEEFTVEEIENYPKLFWSIFWVLALINSNHHCLFNCENVIFAEITSRWKTWWKFWLYIFMSQWMTLAVTCGVWLTSYMHMTWKITSTIHHFMVNHFIPFT